MFDNKTVGGSIPQEFIKPSTRCSEAMTTRLAGYPVVDVNRPHRRWVASTRSTRQEMAFKMAGIDGIQGSDEEREPVLLEPIMEVEVATPEDTWVT